jgi:hypothetical protein
MDKMIANEICEMLIGFGGPLVSIKLSQTCKDFNQIFKVVRGNHATNKRGTITTFNDYRWVSYFDIEDYTISIRYVKEYQSTLGLNILFKPTGRTLYTELYYEYGNFVNESRTTTYIRRNNGLFEQPEMTEHRFYFNITGVHIYLTVFQSKINHDILYIKLESDNK